MKKLVILQANVSQLDEPVYAEIAKRMGDAFHVIYWNDYGFERARKDAETGLVPRFQETTPLVYERTWIDRTASTWRDVFEAIAEKDPGTAILTDIGRVDRAKLSLALRLRGIRTALRSDKNALSETVNNGAKHLLERGLNRVVYSALAPVSTLTRDYYQWPEGRSLVYFPYSTRRSKFAPPTTVRAERAAVIRGELGISEDSTVFVSAAKFSERENPWCIIKAFEQVVLTRPNVSLIALGDGALMGEIRAYCAESDLPIHLPGFVDFAVLQDYFFAGHVFVHFPRFEPWGVSPQDALVAGMGLVAGDTVGSAQCILSGEERRFLVDVDDVDLCAARMGELADLPDPTSPFAAAHLRAVDFCAEHVAEDLVSFSQQG
ncbi:MAG: glycosyltransferase [Pseudomonadota bacterium]